MKNTGVPKLGAVTLSYDKDDIKSMMSALAVIENDIKVLRKKKITTVIDEMVVTGATKGSFNGAVNTRIHKMRAGPQSQITFSLI